MSEPKCNSFFGLPSLGGKLTLVNATFWLTLAILARSESLPREVAEYVWIPLVVVMILFSLPFGCYALIPSVGGPSEGDIVFSAVCLGLNSFAWGYGLAWCIECVANYYNKPPKSELPTSNN